jgi:hypothetical protein
LIDRERLIKLLGVLGSDHNGEIASAGRMADALIRDAGVTWADVIAPDAVQQELVGALRAENEEPRTAADRRDAGWKSVSVSEPELVRRPRVPRSAKSVEISGQVLVPGMIEHASNLVREDALRRQVLRDLVFAKKSDFASL